MTGVTGVRGARASNSWFILDLPRVARFSLFLACVTFLGNPSCLLSSVAEFPEPVPSPPFVDANTALATPQGGTGVPITRLLRVTSDTEEVTLSTDVRSEDAGRLLRSRAFINYKIGELNYDFVFGGEAIAPGTFEDIRRISASFDLKRIEDGCYQVALVITHEFDERAFIPVSQDDTAILIWWMVKGDPGTINMGQCPGVPPSANLDAGTEGGS
jgi:hypothetical protein